MIRPGRMVLANRISNKAGVKKLIHKRRKHENQNSKIWRGKNFSFRIPHSEIQHHFSPISGQYNQAVRMKAIRLMMIIIIPYLTKFFMGINPDE